MNKIGFWKVKEPFGEFSNWYPCEFDYLGTHYISSEQALMHAKACVFEDYETATKILRETNNKNIKQLGRQIKNYDEGKWSKIRYGLMINILYAKFSQNEHLKNLLLTTEDALLYEASPLDNIWGIGSTDLDEIKGQNLLGNALMQVRELLQG